MNELNPIEMIALRERVLGLAVNAYDKGMTHAKRSPIELSELYMSYILGTLSE
jgi:hypothetical protein